MPGPRRPSDARSAAGAPRHGRAAGAQV